MNFEKTKHLNMKKSSMKNKLLFFPILILFLAILIIAVASTLSFKKHLYKTMEDNGILLAKTLTSMLNNTTSDYYQPSIEHIVEDQTIEYATIIDRNYEVIAHSNPKLIGTAIENYATKTAAVDGQIFSTINYYEPTQSDCLHIMYPLFVNGEHMGAIILGFHLTEVHNAIYTDIGYITMIGLALLIILGVFLYKLTTNTIHSINIIMEQMNQIALGELKIILPDKLLKKEDELGKMAQAILAMKDSLSHMIYTIVGKSEQLSATAEELSAITKQSTIVSNEIANAVSQISEGAMVQSEKTMQGRQSISELAGLIDNNNIYVDELTSSSQTIHNLIHDGYQIVDELVNHTKNNTTATKEINSIITNTNENVVEVANASDMIKNIAAQTNLLALNATIEAARAGEAGKGFAVVASEIRKLADEASTLSEQISQVISNLIVKTNYASESMNKVANIVTSQSDCVEKTNETFKGIANAIDVLKSLGMRINTSSDNMNEKKEMIYNIIDNLASISEENAASTEETTASVEEQTSSLDEISQASEELAIISQELTNIVHKFKL